MRTLLLASTALALALTACTTPAAPPQTTAATAPAAVPASEDERLTALFHTSDEDALRRNPIAALFRGDMRYADRLGDFITDEYFAGERAAAERELAALHAIDRTKLSPTNQLAWDVFDFQTRDTIKNLAPDMLALTVVRPINHFSGFQTFYPTFASGEGQAPFKTVEDYDNNLKRHREFIVLFDRGIGRMREGMASGVVESKLTIRNVIDQLDTQLKLPLAENSYYKPVTKFPEGIPAAEQERLKTAYRTMVESEMNPAYQRMRDFLANDYLPVAREQVGISAMKGGAEVYRRLIESTTTLPLQPEEVHQLGLSEVARIRQGMDEVRREVGFKGTLAQFFDHLRTDPKFKMPTRQALTDGYYAIGKRVDALLPQYFGTLPKTGLVILPYEEFREKYQAGGSYESGTPDGSRPGKFFFNAYDLPSRTTPGMTTLYLHEGAPGHHFQISLAQENEALPAFMRFGGNTAFVEGWALYAETLGYEMGLFKDPYQRFGTLSDEMLRAMRLVVDTGIHAKGWTRDQAIEYMLSNSDMGRTDATAEVERYIAIPSQALAYKIGALTIQRLRKQAEAELGARFDLKGFHDQVLMSGALPLPVLEAKIARWVAARKAG